MRKLFQTLEYRDYMIAILFVLLVTTLVTHITYVANTNEMLELMLDANAKQYMYDFEIKNKLINSFRFVIQN